MKDRKCDLCKETIRNPGCGESPCYGVSFGTNNEYDLCDECIKLVRRAICTECEGKGRVRIVDEDATHAQATCGENRTQYRTIECKKCQ